MSHQDRHSFPQSNGARPNGHSNYGNAGMESKPQRDVFNTNADDVIDIKHLLGVLLRYKWWVVGITALFLGASIYIANEVQPVYQSSGTLLITQDRNQYAMGGSELSNMMSSSFGLGTGNSLANEMVVLRSRGLASEIAGKLVDRETMQNGDLFPILWAEYPEDSSKVSQSQVASRISNKMQLQRTDSETDVIRISFSSYSALEAKELVDITIDTYTELSASQKRTAASSALAFLERERETVQERLDEAEVALRNYRSETNLIQVSEQTNAVISRLTELESQRQQLQVQRVAINSSIESYEDQLEQIRPGLAEQFAENISGRLESAQLRLAELRTEQALMKQRNPGLENNPEGEPQFIQNQKEIETVRNEIRDITNNLLNADDSDVYIGFLEQEDGGITQRILELRRQLIELKIEESQLNAQEQVIEERMQEENQFFDGLPDNMLELARLQRDVLIQEQLFTQISSQYAETQLWEQTQFGAGRPIDDGNMPSEPTSPDKTRYALIGLLIGGVVSVGFVFAKDSFNSTIKSAEELKATDYSLLTVVPNFDKHVKQNYEGKKFINIKDKKISTAWETALNSVSPISESYRRLQNNIVFSDPDHSNQTIVVTSSRKGEGKTTVSTNLAVSLAEGGKKVLLIDCDLRRPNVHTTTGEAREPGLTDLFFNDKTVEDVIKPTIAPSVHVITAGQEIPNPAALMQSKELRKLLDDMRDQYDHIIIDTPPYGVITDAAPLMQKADGIVLVSMFGETQSYELEQAIEKLKQVRARVIGTVLTAYNHRKSDEYYYYSYNYDNYQAYEEYRSS